MPFSPKAWKNEAAGKTPLSAPALKDLEERLATYTDLKTPISVKEFGAKGDGVTDDTAAIQAAIDAAIAASRALYLPPGQYKITAELVADIDNFHIYGAGARVSVIVPAASTYNALSIGTGEGPNTGPTGYARDFGIAGGNAEPLKTGVAKGTGKAALHLNSMAVFEVSNVRVSGNHDIGFDLENNCYGTVFHMARTEYDDCRVAVNLRVGTENGEDILFHNCWLSGEVAAIHATQGKNYRVIGGQLSASRQAASAEDLRGVVILGKDYLTGEAGGDCGIFLETSIEYFQQCWAIRAFKQAVVKADASFHASGAKAALGFYKNSVHASSQIVLDACLFEGDYSAGSSMVVIEGAGSGSTWMERGSWGPYKDSKGETNANWNNMARRGEVSRAVGSRDGNIFYMQGMEFKVNSGILEVSELHKETWKPLISTGGAITSSGKLTAQGEIEVDGDLNHDGSKVGFYGTAPATKPTALTAATAETIDTTYGEQEKKTIENLRTRVNQLEEKLKSLGLLS